jgi:putative flippase GtrA
MLARRKALLQHPAVRFLVSGGIVAAISLSLTTTLKLTGTPFQLAFIVGYACGIAAHFALHRYFTFASVEAYALSARSQAQRFVMTVLAQYVIIAVGVAVLAPLLGVPDLVVYFALIVVMSVGNFLITRHRIFHGDAGHRPATGDPVGLRPVDPSRS